MQMQPSKRQVVVKKRKHKILQEENIWLGVSKDEDEETMTVNTERATTWQMVIVVAVEKG